MRLLVIGSPGSGKGTLASIICEKADLLHLSTGDLFRKNIQEQTALGIEAARYINDGNFVPDEVTNALVHNLLRVTGQKGFLLDGYPRTLNQAKALDEYLSELNVELDGVIEVIVPSEVIIRRLEGRRVCPDCGASYHLINKPSRTGELCEYCSTPLIHRPDDRRETIEKRLEIYHQETEELLSFYKTRGLLKQVDNSAGIAEVERVVQKLMEDLKKR